jgi:hypothetical protein
MAVERPKGRITSDRRAAPRHILRVSATVCPVMVRQSPWRHRRSRIFMTADAPRAVEILVT